MHIRKLLSMACCIIVMIAVCLFVTMSCVGIMCLFHRHSDRYSKAMIPHCLEVSPCFEPPIHTYTPTYTVIVDTDGMEHTVINPISVGPSGSSILKDTDGHTVIFYENKFYHGLDRTQCIKCYELSRLPNNN